MLILCALLNGCWYLKDIEKDWGYVLFTNSEIGEKLGNDLSEYFLEEEKGEQSP